MRVRNLVIEMCDQTDLQRCDNKSCDSSNNCCRRAFIDFYTQRVNTEIKVATAALKTQLEEKEALLDNRDNFISRALKEVNYLSNRVANLKDLIFFYRIYSLVMTFVVIYGLLNLSGVI